MKVFLIFLLSFTPLLGSQKTENGERISKNPIFPDQKIGPFIIQKQLETLKDLHESGHFWYKTGNVAEGLSHVFTSATPLLLFLSSNSINLPRKDLFMLLSGFSATFVLSCNHFAKYAHNESRERFKDLDALLLKNGYKQTLGIMGDSLKTDTADPDTMNSDPQALKLPSPEK